MGVIDQDKLIEIIRKLQTNRQEWDTVDAKQDLPLKEVGSKAEFVKDVIAMANNGKPSFLIIGLKDGTFVPVEKLNNHYRKSDLNQIIVNKIDPAITIGYHEFTVNGNEYGVVEIYGQNPPYIVARDIVHDLQDRKRVRVDKGMIYVRHEDRIEGISRLELEKYFKGGIRKIFEDETEHAIQLAINKPEYWEYLLTAELLRSKLALTKRKIEDLKKGLIYQKSSVMNGEDFLLWLTGKNNDFGSLAETFKVAVTNEMPASWGKSGESGNLLEIKLSVDRIASLCNELLEWELSFRSVIPPDPFFSLKQMMEGWTFQFFDQIESISGRLLEPFEQPNPEGKYFMNLVFNPPTNIDQVMAEFKRLRMNPHLWITS